MYSYKSMLCAQKREKKQQKRKTKNVGDDLARALDEGWVDINLIALNQSELVDMVDKVCKLS